MADMRGFNPDQVPDDGGFEPVPAGQYELEVVASELKDTKAGTGKYLKLQHKIVSGPYEGKMVFSQHNFINDNATAQQIGQQEIKRLCAAIGHTGPLEDSNQLHGIPFMANVVVKADAGYEPRNEIKRFIAPGGAPHGGAQNRAAPHRPASSAPPPPAAGGQRPGWMSRAGAGAR